MGELACERDAIRVLISRSDPGDALTTYYALYHSPTLTRLYIRRDATGLAVAFVAVCTTGADLFRPLVVMRARDEDLLGPLLREALVPGRPYHIVAPLRYTQVIKQQVAVTERRTGVVLELDRTRFMPVMNVLVVPSPAVGGGLRFEIRSGDRVMAASGTNWMSPDFAEIYVYREPEARGRAWGRSVASACTAALLQDGLRPLYVTEQDNTHSMRLANALGYRDTGRRELIATGVRRP